MNELLLSDPFSTVVLLCIVVALAEWHWLVIEIGNAARKAQDGVIYLIFL